MYIYTTLVTQLRQTHYTHSMMDNRTWRLRDDEEEEVGILFAIEKSMLTH